MSVVHFCFGVLVFFYGRLLHFSAVINLMIILRLTFSLFVKFPPKIMLLKLMGKVLWYLKITEMDFVQCLLSKMKVPA